MKPLLQVERLSIQFGGLKAVDNVSFEIWPNEVFSLIGPNGAGKTTIFNLISGLYQASSGFVTFEGEKISTLAPYEIARLGIARTFQNIELFEHATVMQNLLVGRHCHRHTNWLQDLFFTPATRRAELQFRRTVEEVIEFLDLQHYRDQMVAGLPYGVRKVVELGRALSMRPKLLLLDEPSSGLNVDETEDMGFWIEDIKHDLGITVLMVEHDMGLVSRVSDRVLALNQGEMLALGTSVEVQSHPDVIEAYLGGADDDSLPPSPLPAEGGAQAHPDGGRTALPPSPSPKEGVTSHPAPPGSGAGGEGKKNQPAASSGRPGAGGES